MLATTGPKRIDPSKEYIFKPALTPAPSAAFGEKKEQRPQTHCPLAHVGSTNLAQVYLGLTTPMKPGRAPVSSPC